MVVIGVTGGVGTGKSTVARMFRELGASALDADVIAHRVMEPGKPAWRRIVKAFGKRVLNPDRTVNRTRLAAAVFNDPEERRRLESIVHPPVLREIRRALARLRRERKTRSVVVEIPLLLEVGAEKLVDVIVVVTAPAEAQRRRLKQQRGWSDKEIRARAKAQWDLPAKVALADAVIDNGNGVEATRTQVKRIWKQRVPDKARAAGRP
jgi:dephospho-CoA kinase